ncbi:MAG: calcium-binding protein [Proteobacteria bacterium]|nr:calcium-binding protein [Pseudomonadota bacterium]
MIRTTQTSYNLGSNIENLTYTGTAPATFGGNNGNNRIDASSATDAVSLSGNGGRDTLIGGTGNDILRGAASSSLVGGEGNDTIFAEGTDISIDAGNGENTIVFSTAAQMKAAATIIGGTGVDTVQIDSKVRLYDADFANFSGIEKLVLTSNPTDGGNYIELGLLANARGLETVISGTGNDTIDAGAFNASVTLVGDGGGDNWLIGSSAGDSIYGGIGSETILGNAGNDTIFGGGGADSILGGAGDDDTRVSTAAAMLAVATLSGGADNDTLNLTTDSQTVDDTNFAKVDSILTFQVANGVGSNVSIGSSGGNADTGGIQFLLGGNGGDTLTGYTDQATTISGNDGNDSIIGGTATDSLFGGVGNDTIAGGGGSDIVLGGAGNDSLFGHTSGAASLFGGEDDDIIVGNGASDTLDGGAGNDSLFGNTVAETLLGGDANDTILGGGGVDSILGGDGNDVIEFSTAVLMAAAATIAGGTGADTVVLTTDAQTITDANFGGFDSINVLELADGANIVDAGAAAVTAGIATIVGGNDADSLQIATMTTFTSLIGGTGDDTVALTTDAQTITNANFGGFNSINVLELANGANIVDAGAAAVTAGIATIVGGNDADSLQIATMTTFTSLIGGTGDDTVALTTDAQTITNANFGGFNSINVLELANGANIVDAGATAVAAGIATIVGGNDADSLQIATMTSFTSLIGGLGTDTVALTTNAQIIGDADFGGFDSINVLELADGANIVEAGATAVTAGIATIVGGANDDSFQVATMTSFTSLIGGLGNDTVALTTNAQNIGDADFGGFDSINVLELADGSNIVDVGTTALTAGIATIVGGINADRLDIGVDYDGNQAVTLLGGAGDDSLLGRDQADSLVGGDDNDVINGRGGADNILGGDGTDTLIFATAIDLATAASVIGGLGNDTISIANAGGSVVDTNFDDVDTVEALVFTDGGNCSAILETEAQQAGIVSVFGGVGNDTFDASSAAYNATGLYFQGNGGVDSLVGGGSTDKFVFSTAAALNLASTVAGGNGNDTISLTTHNQAVVDADFTDVLSVEVLTFADGTGSSAVLAGTANTAGIASVYGGSGNDTLTVDESEALYGDVTTPTFHGADGVDVLILSNDTATLVDSFFTNVLSVDSFQTANGANDITLGTEASEAGISIITGGTGDDILNASAMTSAVTLLGGLGADTLTGGSGGSRQQGWTGTSTVNVSSDTLTGGSGTDRSTTEH